jgi:hypothetical protein
MRRGIIRVAVFAAVLAVLVFGVPLAYVMNRLLLGDEQAELEKLALRAAVSVPAGAVAGGDPVELPKTEASIALGVYDARGLRMAGTGPEGVDAEVRQALRGTVLRERAWHGLLAAKGRPLRLLLQEPPLARASEAAVRQIVEVLIDNAYRHGRGAVVIAAREANEAVAIDVKDDGSTTGVDLLPDGVPAPAWSTGPRLGLSLARRLAEAEGGRLLHARTEQRTRLTLLLPAAGLPSDE